MQIKLSWAITLVYDTDRCCIAGNWTDMRQILSIFLLMKVLLFICQPVNTNLVTDVLIRLEAASQGR